MNRLVLIGNGFDLAHGLKTSYKNFIFWYWDQWGYRLLHSLEKTDTDGLCSFKIKDNVEVANWASVFQGWYYKRGNPFIPWKTNDVINLAMNDRDLCDFTIMSPLLQRICKHLSYGWVDIENEYYSLLTLRNSPIKPSTEQDVKDLNYHLNILCDYLISYLRIEEKKDVGIINEIKDKIFRPIMEQEISVAFKNTVDKSLLEEKDPKAIMLLNFNYTNTPEQYVTESSKVKVIFIHGKLDNRENVIFGYGDELDDGYKKLQELNENDVLRHIKSIRYLESDNYRKMLEFIESAPFQVCIMGHSCGNSDRTLLNTLFEHRNCISVKPYYYIKGQEDNYLELVQNISRNFTDMKLMRDRVVNKEYCEPLTIRDNN